MVCHYYYPIKASCNQFMAEGFLFFGIDTDLGCCVWFPSRNYWVKDLHDSLYIIKQGFFRMHPTSRPACQGRGGVASNGVGKARTVEYRRASPVHDILNSPSARVARRGSVVSTPWRTAVDRTLSTPRVVEARHVRSTGIFSGTF